MARIVARIDGQLLAHEFDAVARIGRAPDNDLVLSADGVSRYHAQIARQGAGYVVRDLGSKNGTLLNGARIEGEVPLGDGDVVGLPGVDVAFEAARATVTIVAPLGPAPRGATPDVTVDPARAEVRVRGVVVALPPKEYRALELLVARRGAVVSKEELARHVWPEYNGDVSDYNIHQVVSRLRRAIEDDPAHPARLLTRPGFGYLFAG